MKARTIIVAFFSIVSFCGSAPAELPPDPMHALIRSRPELDEIRWYDPARHPLKVRIIEARGQSLTVEKTLAAGLIRKDVRFSELCGLTFTLTPQEQSLHRQPAAASIPLLKIYWELRQATLSQSGSNVAETGLVLAKSLRLNGDPESLEEAGKILDQIRSQDSLQHRRDRARDEQVVVDLVRSQQRDRPEITDQLAWQITAHPENIDAMLLATAFLANRHFKDLKVIEEANPRWIEDDEIRPIRERLYHLAIDFSLYPSLFAGTRGAEASNGLKHAADIYQFVGANILLKGVLEDLAALYPSSPAAIETAALLVRLRQLEATGKLSPSVGSTDEKISDDESSSPTGTTVPIGPPPPPKRYNLFND